MHEGRSVNRSRSLWWIAFVGSSACLATSACAGAKAEPSKTPPSAECPPQPAASATECACDESPSDADSASSTPAVSTKEAAEIPPFDDSKRQDVEYLNERLLTLDSSLQSTAVSLGSQILGEGATGIRTLTVDYLNDRGKPVVESPTKAVVVVTADLLDDSVQQERFRIELSRTAAGGWRYTNVEMSWKCHAGRGSQDFTTKRCS